MSKKSLLSFATDESKASVVVVVGGCNQAIFDSFLAAAFGFAVCRMRLNEERASSKKKRESEAQSEQACNYYIPCGQKVRSAASSSPSLGCFAPESQAEAIRAVLSVAALAPDQSDTVALC